MKKQICIFLSLIILLISFVTACPNVLANGNIFTIPANASGDVLEVIISPTSQIYNALLYIDGAEFTHLSGTANTTSKNVDISSLKAGRHVALFVANTKNGVVSEEKYFTVSKNGAGEVLSASFLSGGSEILESAWENGKPIPAADGYKFTLSSDVSGSTKLYYFENGKKILLDASVTKNNNTVTVKTARAPFENTIYIAEFGSSLQYAFRTCYSDNVTVYKNFDFEKELGFTYYASTVDTTSGEVIERKTIDGNGVFHAAIDSSKDGFFAQTDTETLLKEDNYVIDFKIYISKIEGSASLAFFEGKDSSGSYREPLTINSLYKISQKNASWGGQKVSYTFGKDTWYRIVIAYNISTGKYNFYVYNGDTRLYIKENCSIVGARRPTYLKIDLISGGAIDFMLDDFRIYSGSEKRDYLPSDVKSLSSIMEKPADAKKTLGAASVFTTDSDNYYFANEKRKYLTDAEKPVEIDAVPYLSGEFLQNVLLACDTVYADKIVVGSTTFEQGSEGVISKNGKLYLRADKAAAALGKTYTYDDRGYFVFSTGAFSAINSGDIDEIFDSSDTFYRYIMMENPRGEEVLDDFKEGELYGVHPRILFTNKEIEWILNLSNNGDDEVKKEIENIIDIADGYLNWSRITANDADSVKQNNATSAQNVISYFAEAYLLTGDEKYANAGIKILDAAAAWKSLAWNNSNLTTGHWAALMAIGYDSFYNYLNKTSSGRAKLQAYRDAIENLAFSDTILAYSGGNGPHWITIADNFSGVIGGGMLTLCMAVADEGQFKDKMPYLLENILKTNALSAVLYYNDGGYFEGVRYSEYMLTNLSMGVETLFKACKSDYGISNARGFKKAGNMFAYLNTPTQAFDFSDCEPQPSKQFVPLWFGYRYGEREAAELNMKRMRMDEQRNESIRNIFFYKKMIEKYGETSNDISLDYYFPKTLTGSFRNSFDKKYPIAAFYHLAKNGTTHDHLDAGQWEFETNGIKWAMDLGPDSYDLPNYFSNEGYKIYRKHTQGHNVVLINPTTDSDNYLGQNIEGKAELLSCYSEENEANVKFDLTDVYMRDVSAYTREFTFADNRTTFTVCDEITLKNSNSDIYWFMHTEADINVIDKNNVILKKGGHTLRAVITCSAANYEVLDMEAKPLPGTPEVSGQKEETAHKLAIHIPSSSGKETISVKLIPYAYTLNVKGDSANVCVMIPDAGNYNFTAPRLFIAFYDADENICGMKIKTLDFAGSKIDFSDSFTLPPKTKTAKALLWDGMDIKKNPLTVSLN